QRSRCRYIVQSPTDRGCTRQNLGSMSFNKGGQWRWPLEIAAEGLAAERAPAGTLSVAQAPRGA
ncbi:MAG: hypothetical protein ACUVX9_03235, partial [Anaerolineae bacterium]